MKTSPIEPLVPAIEVLAEVMKRTSENYQQLLHQPEAHSFCLEAGRSLRSLSSRYAQVLVAAFESKSDTYLEEDDDDFDGEEDSLSELDIESED